MATQFRPLIRLQLLGLMLASVAALCSPCAAAVINQFHPGNVTGTETWHAQDSSGNTYVHVVDHVLKISNSGRLTIEPNAIVAFSGTPSQIQVGDAAAGTPLGIGTLIGGTAGSAPVKFRNFGAGTLPNAERVVFSALSIGPDSRLAASFEASVGTADVVVDGMELTLQAGGSMRLVLRNHSNVITKAAVNAAVNASRLTCLEVACTGSVTNYGFLRIENAASLSMFLASSLTASSGGSIEIERTPITLGATTGPTIQIQDASLRIESCDITTPGSVPLIRSMIGTAGGGGSSIDLRSNRVFDAAKAFDVPGVVDRSPDTAFVVEPRAFQPPSPPLNPPQNLEAGSPHFTNVSFPSQSFVASNAVTKRYVTAGFSFESCGFPTQINWTMSALSDNSPIGTTTGTGIPTSPKLVELPSSYSCTNAAGCPITLRLTATCTAANRSLAYDSALLVHTSTSIAAALSQPSVVSVAGGGYPTYPAGSPIAIIGTVPSSQPFVVEAHLGVDLQAASPTAEWISIGSGTGSGASATLATWTPTGTAIRVDRDYTVRVRSPTAAFLSAQGYLRLLPGADPSVEITVPENNSTIFSCIGVNRPTAVRGIVTAATITSLTARWARSTQTGTPTGAWTNLTPVAIASVVSGQESALTTNFPPPAAAGQYTVIEVTVVDQSGKVDIASSVFQEGAVQCTVTGLPAAGFSPDAGYFDAVRGDRMQLQSIFPGVLRVTVDVVSTSTSLPIRRLVTDEIRPGGQTFFDTWDGRDDAGILPLDGSRDGTYVFRLTLATPNQAFSGSCASPSFTLDTIVPRASITAPTVDHPTLQTYWLISNIRGNTGEGTASGEASDANCRAATILRAATNGIGVTPPDASFSPIATVSPCSASGDRVLGTLSAIGSPGLYVVRLEVSDHAGHVSRFDLFSKRADLKLVSVAPNPVNWQTSATTTITLQVPESMPTAFIAFLDFLNLSTAGRASFTASLDQFDTTIELPIPWNGIDGGIRVPDNVYRMRIHFDDAMSSGQTFELDLTANRQLFVQPGIVDARDFYPSLGETSDEISYSFSQPSEAFFVVSDENFQLSCSNDDCGDPRSFHDSTMIPVVHERVPATAGAPIQRTYSWDGTVRPGSVSCNGFAFPPETWGTFYPRHPTPENADCGFSENMSFTLFPGTSASRIISMVENVTLTDVIVRLVMQPPPGSSIVATLSHGGRNYQLFSGSEASWSNINEVSTQGFFAGLPSAGDWTAEIAVTGGSTVGSATLEFQVRPIDRISGSGFPAVFPFLWIRTFKGAYVMTTGSDGPERPNIRITGLSHPSFRIGDPGNDGQQRRSLAVSYDIESSPGYPATVILEVLDPALGGDLAARVIHHSEAPVSGSHTVAWDGTRSDGSLVPIGGSEGYLLVRLSAFVEVGGSRLDSLFDYRTVFVEY